MRILSLLDCLRTEDCESLYSSDRRRPGLSRRYDDDEGDGRRYSSRPSRRALVKGGVRGLDGPDETGLGSRPRSGSKYPARLSRVLVRLDHNAGPDGVLSLERDSG